MDWQQRYFKYIKKNVLLEKSVVQKGGFSLSEEHKTADQRNTFMFNMIEHINKFENLYTYTLPHSVTFDAVARGMNSIEYMKIYKSLIDEYNSDRTYNQEFWKKPGPGGTPRVYIQQHIDGDPSKNYEAHLYHINVGALIFSSCFV